MRKLILLVCFTLNVHAQASGADKRVLIPVLPTRAAAPGAFGSLWVTNVHIVHNAAQPIRVYPYGSCNVILCFLSPPPIPPGVTVKLGIESSLQRASFLFVQADAIDRVNLTLRVQDTSRASLNFGTTVPTPTEDEFRSTTFSIAEVPTDARFRNRLRIYSLENAPSTVTVRVYAARNVPSSLLFDTGVDADPLLRMTTHVLETQQPLAQLSTPALIEIPLDLTGITDEFVRVEIEPASSARLWAFVSVTNNEAQHITVLTP